MEFPLFNSPPVVSNPLIHLDYIVGEPLTLRLAANTFTDPDAGDSLTYSLTLEDGSPVTSGITIDPNTGEINVQEELHKRDTLLLNAKDRQGAQTSTKVNLNSQQDYLLNETVNVNHPFSVRATFPLDGQYPAAYAATLADNNPLPNWLTFDPTTRTLQGTPRRTDIGQIEVVVKATFTPNFGSTDANIPHTVEYKDHFQINVLNVNNPPTLVNPIPPQGVVFNHPFQYEIPENTFTDLDGGPLTYTSSVMGGQPLPAWLNFNPTTRVFRGTPSLNDYGVLSIEVKVIDREQASTTNVFTLNVDIDAAQYGASYPDLIQTYGDNLPALGQHYRLSGRTENRHPDLFPEYRYLASYDDLLNVYKTDVAGATEHYLRSGYREGRDPLLFKPDLYLASYGDLIQHLAASGVNDYNSKLHFAEIHYVTSGHGEQRSRQLFDPQAYLQRYTDLQGVFGEDLAKATEHYINTGYFEGRTWMS